MLLREEPDGGIVAIAQPAHAALAGRLAEAWDDDLPQDLVMATGRHDDVWAQRDAAARLNPATGRPLTFLELTPEERVEIWSQASTVAIPLGPEAELWVLRHAERLHAAYDQPAVKAMVAASSTRVGELLEKLRAAHPTRFQDAELARGTSLLALFDTLSLALCSGVREPRKAGVLTLAPGPAGVVTLAPWPFTGARLDTFVEARRLPSRVADQNALDAAWVAAEPFALDVGLAPTSCVN
ncbi:MAG: DUF3891 family protein [Actinomycetota bacterium]|nr:DUF3891 family protein [Actinomycetota bacterium]